MLGQALDKHLRNKFKKIVKWTGKTACIVTIFLTV